MYYDPGQFYLYNTKKFLDNKGLNLCNIVAIKVPEMEVQDIDTLDDWNMAEIKYKMMISKGI